jgi:glycosyltransferase involved in cell wall biosynthesis/tetratricopeptide (TPR) repeat protein
MCVHDDYYFAGNALDALDAGNRNSLVCISKVPWGPWDEGDWQASVKKVEASGAEPILCDFRNEDEHRRFAVKEAIRRGLGYVYIPDGDEIAEPKLVDSADKLAATEVADVIFVHLDTYFGTPEHVIRPRERITPAFMIDCRTVDHVHIREYRGRSHIVLPPAAGIVHHLSYNGPDARIDRKLLTSSHRDEFVEGWKQRIWQGWQADRTLKNLHPTAPPCYARTVRIERPEVLKAVENYQPQNSDPKPKRRIPKISIVIALHGGSEDIRACLESIAPFVPHPLTKKGKAPAHVLDIEVIVVDNASPDDAARVAAGFPFVRLICNSENLGFGHASTQGYEASTGEIVLFLNSDTCLTRAALIRLAETLLASGSVGAAGPYSDNAGYHQFFEPGYEDLKNLNLYCQDFAMRDEPDRQVEMLVGFCLAVRRSVLEEVGAFTDEYGLGLFEDNDLIQRIQNAGYKTMLSTRSFVYHAGSKTLNRLPEHPHVRLRRNQAIFEKKFQRERESGFLSHLAGQSPELIRFNPDRSPERVEYELSKLRALADISLCMIVRNEEKVIADCLRSAQGFFNQMVVIDTGSTDGTREIARNFGAEVYDSPWQDSFSQARNESLKYARGRYIFWPDADDTIPFATGMEMLHAAAYGPPNVIGYRMRVQFVSPIPGAGTRVDHLKLFRNIPGLAFEGRVHEQILPSLRQHPGDIGLIHGPVMHTNYDTSPEGQARKKARDRRLLYMDYKDAPTHPFRLFNPGMSNFFWGGQRNAIRWLRRSLKFSQPDHSHVRACYSLIGQSHVLLGELATAETAFLEGLSVVGNDAEIRFRLALLQYSQERFHEALDQLFAMPENTDSFYASLDVGILGYRRLSLIGELHAAMGDLGSANSYFQSAIQANPYDSASACRMFELGQRAQDLPLMRDGAAALLTAEGPGETWARMEASIAELQGTRAEDALWRLASEHPSAPGPLLILSRALIAKGEIGSASDLLQRLDAWGVAEGSESLGRIAEETGDEQLAAWYYNRAVQLEPGRPWSTERLRLTAAGAGEAVS